MTELFDKHTDDYRPIFYHYLDGFIKSDLGYGKTYKFLKTHGEQFIGSENITIGSTLETDIASGRSNNFNVVLYNFADKQEHLISFTSDGIKLIIGGRETSLIIPELKRLFSYAIIQIGDESHAISLCFRINDKKLECYIFNSGEGIENNQNIEVSSQKYYLAGKNIILCDDISDLQKCDFGFNKAIALCLFQHIYFGIRNTRYINKITYNDYENKYIIVNNTFYNLLFFLKKYGCGALKINSTLTIQRLYSQINLITLYFYGNNSNYLYSEPSYESQEVNEEFYLFDNIKLDIEYTLYNILCKEINNNMRDISINKLFSDNTSFENIIYEFKKISELSNISSIVIEKTIFNFHNQLPYIIEQESGSCSWFSFYWPLLLYYVHTNNTSKYVDFIIKINKYFERCLRTIIMSPDNIKESLKGNTFRLIKKIYCKLADIGLGNYKIIEDLNDCLYNNIFDVEQNFDKQILHKNYIFPNYPYISYIANVNNIFIEKIYNELIQCDISQHEHLSILFNGINNLNLLQNNNNVDCFVFTNTQFLFYYIVFNFLKSNDIDIFVKIDVEQYYKQIFVNNINRIIKRINKSEYSELRKKLSDILCILDDNNILMHLQQYNYSFDSNNQCYFYKYYHICSIFNVADTDIKNFAILINKFVSFTKILQLLNKMVNGIYNMINQQNYKDEDQLIIDIFHEVYIFINQMFNSNIFVGKYSAISIKTVSEYLKSSVNIYDKMLLTTNYLKNYNECFINISGFIQLNFKSIDDFNETKKFLFLHPEYIYSQFNDKCYISNDIFVRCHIVELSLPSNKHYKENLIRFFAEKFWEYKDKNNEELKNILTNLHLLIFNADCIDNYDTITDLNKFNIFLSDIYVSTDNTDGTEIYIDYSGKKYYAYNDDFYVAKTKFNYNNLFRFNEISNNILDFKKILLHHANSKNIFEFCDFISKKYDEIFIDESKKLIEKIQHVYPNAELDQEKTSFGFTIDSKRYYMTYLYENIGFQSIVNFFRSSNNVPYFFIQSNVAKSIDFIILLDCPQTIVIKIYGNFISANRFEITKVFVNNIETIKFSDIKLPFKYVIPLTCNNLIYKTGNMYNVIYFKYKKCYVNTDLIGYNNCEDGIEIFTINENTMLYPKITSPDTLVNFGKLCENYHVRPLNIIFTKKNQSNIKPNGYCVNDYLCYIFNFNTNKRDFLINKLKPKPYSKFELLDMTIDGTLANLTFSKIPSFNTDEYVNKIKHLIKINSESYNKLLDKIEMCKITGETKNTKLHLEQLKNTIICEIERTYVYYNNKYLDDIFSEYTSHLNFILKIKMLNHINILLDTIDDEINFCSQIKVLKSITDNRKYNLQYNFELFFETISGYELLDEQFDRYYEIITNYTSSLTNINDEFVYRKSEKKYSENEESYNILKYQQVGGANNYPLHHFMMGKGKSSTMTPLLSLYFILIHNKEVYTIMPEHLVKDSKSFINQYMYINDCDHKIYVCSDSEIKKKFLDQNFINDESNKNTVFIIDEFDSLLDPLKSNFNIVEKKDIEIIKLFNFIYPYIKNLKQNQLLSISSDLEDIKSYVLNDINQIIKSIESYDLIENINWGINKDKCYAVPYIKKDKPAPNSNFSSIIITIFLTLYYYIVINEYKVSESIIAFIIKNGIYERIFNTHKPREDVYIESIKIINSNSKIKEILFDVFFETIFKRIMVPSEQYNVSFVDILNIDNIYKIGYSGTINLTLPPLPREENKFKDINIDNDEFINVSYALNNGRIFTINKNDLLSESKLLSNYFDNFKNKYQVDINNYDALIDQYGLFKNIMNKNIAIMLSRYLNLNTKSRDIIYISEDDNKLVIDKDTEIESKYNSSTKYSKPFIYYSQAHTIGVDIKQDYYPVMKGLITLGYKSLYTNVAQAIFRLRKINLGHSIDIIYMVQTSDIIVPTSGFNILEQLKCNEEKINFNKQDLLIYQTLKSEIRKKRTFGKNSYIEYINHYFINGLPSKIEEYYSGVFDESDVKSLSSLFNKINTVDKLKKLIYNIGSNSTTTEVFTTLESESEILVNININFDKTGILDNLNLWYDYIKYDFSKISKKEIFENLTIQLNDYIHFVPNICCQSTGSKFKYNKSGYAYVFIDSLSKLLLIPGYMVPFFYEKYIILDSKFLYLLNNNMIQKYEELIGIINCFKNKNFISFIEKASIPHKNVISIENFISVIILSNYNDLFQNHINLIKYFQQNIVLFTDNIKKHIDKWVSERNRKQIIIENNPNKLTSLDDINLSLFGIVYVEKKKEIKKPPVKISTDNDDWDGGGQSNINKIKKYAIIYNI